VTDVKACCAAAYDSDVVELVLGTSYHPGGLALTRRLAQLAELRPGQRLLDVACGQGTSALLLAREHGLIVDGVDLGEESLQRARAAAEQAGLTDRARFSTGDAERLPFDDSTFDAVLSECAFCTLPDKPPAAAAFGRVLRPGGRVAISDVTVAAGALPQNLRDLAGWIACLADARPLEEYARLFTDAGLPVTTTERHDEALARVIEQIDARLRALRMTGALDGLDVPRALELTRQAGGAVAAGHAGYALLVASKP